MHCPSKKEVMSLYINNDSDLFISSHNHSRIAWSVVSISKRLGHDTPGQPKLRVHTVSMTRYTQLSSGNPLIILFRLMA